MGLFQFPHNEIMNYILVFIRISAMIAWFPIFGDKNTPITLKILFSFVVALIVYPVIKPHITIQIPENLIGLLIIIFHEVSIGLLIGLVAKGVFYAIGFGAQLISFQMGFGMVSVMDPNTQSRVSLINQFQMAIATLLFFATNMHHVFFGALITSYSQVAPGSFALTAGFLTEILRITSSIFVVGFKIAAPVAVVLLITNAGLGVLSRAVPQMNVYMVSFPITISLGFLILALSIPLFITFVGKEYELIADNIISVLKTI